MQNLKMRTRGKSSVKSSAESSSTSPKITLKPEPNPPKIFILPKDASPEARLINLANPRSSLQARYLHCPKKGFYEFTMVSAPKTLPRSFLLSPSEPNEAQERSQNAQAQELDDNEYSASSGYVTKTAEMFIATPIDPLFLMLPALAPLPSKSSERTKRHFLSWEDYRDTLMSNSPHFKPLLRAESTRKSMEARMAAVCDTVDVGDETMYRLNDEKLLQELLHKAEKMAAAGLPASMEEIFVRKALEVPMLCLKRGESSTNELAEEGEALDLSDTCTPATNVDSQTTASSTATASTSTSFASTAPPSQSEDYGPKPVTKKEAAPHPIDASEGIAHLLRLRTVLTFITTSYVPPHVQASLDALLAAPSASSVVAVPDFTPLTARLAHLAQVREQQLAARSLNYLPRKRALDEDDDEGGETRAQAKRRRDEEEKRKKSAESRAVRDLKKVNVSGMKKMSEFFKKK